MRFPLQDEKGFYGPEEAAFHACLVQDGFSTPEREAARMLLDGGAAADRARAWMAGKGLADGDLEWDPGMLTEYRHLEGELPCLSTGIG